MITFTHYENIDLLYVHFEGSISEEDFGQYLDTFKKYMEISQTLYIMFDVRKLEYVSMTSLYQHIKFLNENERLSGDVIKATSIIVVQDWAKKLLNFMFEIKKPQHPMKITDAIQKAREFLLDQQQDQQHN